MEEEDEIADGSEHDKYVRYGTLQHNCHLNGCVAGLTILSKIVTKENGPNIIARPAQVRPSNEVGTFFALWGWQ